MNQKFNGWIGGAGIGQEGGTGFWGGNPKVSEAFEYIMMQNKAKLHSQNENKDKNKNKDILLQKMIKDMNSNQK